jgi:hypothetical protein
VLIDGTHGEVIAYIYSSRACSSTFIRTYVRFPPPSCSGLNSPRLLSPNSNSFKKDNIVLKGPPRRLSSPKITDILGNLALDENGDQFVGYGKKHNWTHKCGLWELLYVRALILMHNLDVMHQERNVGESILRTYMCFAYKTKDNHKARRDLAQICNQPTLELTDRGGKPRAPFCLKPKDRNEVMSWMQDLKFPHDYATGLRRAINLETGKINGLKVMITTYSWKYSCK